MASLSSAHPAQTYFECHRIRDEALQAANALESVATGAKALGDKKTMQNCTDYREKLLRSDAAYEPAFLIDSQVSSDVRSRGINFAVKYGQVDGMISTNIRNYS